MNKLDALKTHLKSRDESLTLNHAMHNGRHKHATFSWTNYLRNVGKSNDAFEAMVSRLRLEELIALKLDIAFRSIGKGFYGFPIWSALDRIVRISAMIFASSVTRTRQEAAAVLGISPTAFTGLSYTSLRGERLVNKNVLKAVKFDNLLR